MQRLRQMKVKVKEAKLHEQFFLRIRDQRMHVKNVVFSHDFILSIKLCFSVLFQCPHNCQRSNEMLQLLIDKDANVNAIDKYGNTALDAALKANETEGEI